MSCQICHHTKGRFFQVHEMMLGTRDEFHYYECESCGCLQLVNPPEDLSIYYPPDRYYSFQQSQSNTPAPVGLRRVLKRQRDAAILFNRSGLWRRIAERFPNPGIADIARWIGKTSLVSYHSPILDVGCGNGQMLQRMSELGFQSLVGVDPFLTEEVTTERIQLRAASLHDIGGSYELIMLHHAFEHMPDPIQILKSVEARLTTNGVCLIRIPIASEGPWKKYREQWAEIDAPRHFFLHTEKSLSLAANDAGLQIFHIDYESEMFPYACSEMYSRNLSLHDESTDKQRSFSDVFTTEELFQFKKQADQNNLPGFASRAAFYLCRSPRPVLSVDLLSE